MLIICKRFVYWLSALSVMQGEWKYVRWLHQNRHLYTDDHVRNGHNCRPVWPYSTLDHNNNKTNIQQSTRDGKGKCYDVFGHKLDIREATITDNSVCYVIGLGIDKVIDTTINLGWLLILDWQRPPQSPYVSVEATGLVDRIQTEVIPSVRGSGNR